MTAVEGKRASYVSIPSGNHKPIASIKLNDSLNMSEMKGNRATNYREMCPSAEYDISERKLLRTCP